MSNSLITPEQFVKEFIERLEKEAGKKGAKALLIAWVNGFNRRIAGEKRAKKRKKIARR